MTSYVTRGESWVHESAASGLLKLDKATVYFDTSPDRRTLVRLRDATDPEMKQTMQISTEDSVVLERWLKYE